MALCAAALAAGHVLKAVGPADSYRPYSVQERIFKERYTTERLANRPTKKWAGQTWYQRPGTAVAAVPGTSNHGFGLAVDTGEERDSDAGAESLDNATLAWLLANEERFGWSHELQSEPWHLRYFTGDHIPAAVLDHEDLHQPTNHAEEDDDMPLCFVTADNAKDPNDDSTWFLTDLIKARRPMEPGEPDTYVKAGVVKPGPDGKPQVIVLSRAALDRIPLAK